MFFPVLKILFSSSLFFFFNDTATTEIYTLSLHDALPISNYGAHAMGTCRMGRDSRDSRSEEHTSELQSPVHLVCRLLLEKKKDIHTTVVDENKADLTELHRTRIDSV